MRLDYDLDADALYIYVSDRPTVKTVEIDDETMVDLDADGQLVGIEVITIGRIWPLDAILDRYSLSEHDQGQLRAVFPVGGNVRRETPRMSAHTSGQIPAMA